MDDISGVKKIYISHANIMQVLTIIFSVTALCISCYTLYMVLRHN